MQKFSARIDKKLSQLRITDRKLFDQWVMEESAKEGEYLYEIKISKMSKAHSREQENFRWGVMYSEILYLLHESGWDMVKSKDDVHEIVSALFLKQRLINESTGEVIEKPIRSSSLNKEEENEFQEEIRQWAREYFNAELSLPNEQKTIL